MSSQPQLSPAADIPATAGLSAKLSLVTTIAVMTLVSGIFNLLGGVSVLV